MTDAILSVFSGGITGTLLVLLLRGWISERLQQSIRLEYSQKLESHKAELNTRIQTIKHEAELRQLRTSLFFDHQRSAFAGLLAKIAAVNQKWIDEGYVPDEGLTHPVPYDAYKELQAAYYEHQLFLDAPCITAMELVFECYSDSFPFDDGSGPSAKPRDIDAAYDAVQYLQPRLAALFQSRIGVISDGRAEWEIALLGAIRLLNGFKDDEIDLPPKGALELRRIDKSLDAVAKAEDNLDEVLTRLCRFQDYLRREGGVWPEAALSAARYLSILQQSVAQGENDGKVQQHARQVSAESARSATPNEPSSRAVQ